MKATTATEPAGKPDFVSLREFDDLRTKVKEAVDLIDSEFYGFTAGPSFYFDGDDLYSRKQDDAARAVAAALGIDPKSDDFTRLNAALTPVFNIIRLDVERFARCAIEGAKGHIKEAFDRCLDVPDDDPDNQGDPDDDPDGPAQEGGEA